MPTSACTRMGVGYHVHLIGSFDFEQAGAGIDMDALAACYSDPAFWSRAFIEPVDDPLALAKDRTLTVLERWAFLTEIGE